MFSNQIDASSDAMPDLLSYLEDGYRAELRQPRDVKIDFTSFMVWSKAHLERVRPSEIFPVDNNYGILLNNGQRIQVCPDVPGISSRNGNMANPDASVSITRRA